MKTKTLQMILFGFFMAGPMILAVILPQFKWIFFIVVGIIFYSAISRRIRSRPLKFTFFGIAMYIFYELWVLIGAIFMFYWIAGSIGFGFISSIIIFGIGGP